MTNAEEMQEQKKRIVAHIASCWVRYNETQDGKELDRIFALEGVLATINNGLETSWGLFKLWEVTQTKPDKANNDRDNKYFN